MPLLPETPGARPGADIIGRAAGILVDLPVDLQPSGWRFVDRPGRDAARTASFLREDLDELAEAYEGYAGPSRSRSPGRGPSQPRSSSPAASARSWTPARAPTWRRRWPTASGRTWPTCDGSCRVPRSSSSSTSRRCRRCSRARCPRPRASAGCEPSTRRSPRGARDGARRPRRSDRRALLPPLGATAAAPGHRRGALAVDLTAASPARWESVAATLDGGTGVYAGVLATDGSGTDSAARALVLEGLERAGLSADALRGLVVTPACGLASLTPEGARTVVRCGARHRAPTR